MHNLSDEEFDRFFKEADKGYTPGYNPEDWERLSKRLDKETSNRNLLKIIYLLISFTIITGLFILSDMLIHQEQQALSSHETSVALSSPTEQTIVEYFPTEQHNSYATNHQFHPPANTESKQVTVQHQEQPAKNKIVIYNNETIKNTLHRIQGYKNSIIHNITYGVLPEVTGSIVDQGTQDILIHEKEQTESSVHRKLWIKSALSPDLTSIGTSVPHEVGINAGVAVEYGITGHISVLSGLYYTGKSYYDANPERRGYAYTSSYYNVNSIAGNCRMLDIPVNIYFHTKAYGKTNFYAGVGASSYLMFKEHYSFLDEQGYELYTNVYDRTKLQLFAVANIAVGVSRPLSPNWSVQLEPYFKGALYELGDGNTKMNSMGIFLNLRYRIK